MNGVKGHAAAAPFCGYDNVGHLLVPMNSATFECHRCLARLFSLKQAQ